MDSWLYIWWTRRAADSPRFPPPTIDNFCDRPSELSRSNRRLSSRSTMEDVLFRLEPGSEGNWPGFAYIKPVYGCKTPNGRWKIRGCRGEGVVFGVFTGFFLFFFFFQERRFISINARRELDDDSIKREERGGTAWRVIINTWKIAVVILETGEMDYWCDVLFRSTRDDVFPDSIKGSTMYHCWHNEESVAVVIIFYGEAKTEGLFTPEMKLSIDHYGFDDF